MNTTDGSSSTAASGVPAPQCQSLHFLLRKRARMAQRVSWGVLVLIVALLVGGIMLVVFPPASVTNAGDWSYGFDYGYSGYGDYSGYSDTYIDPKLSPSSNKDTKETVVLRQVAEIQKRLDANDATNTEQSLQLAALESKNAAIENKVSEVKKSVAEVKEQPKQERKHWEAMFGTILTRFGMAAVVLLLMRFMSSIYRYHARMAAFYDAKADVFEACGGDVNAMEKLSHMLTPSGVDFHETADTLMEHAVDLVKKVQAS